MANADIEGRYTDRRRVQGANALPGGLATMARDVAGLRTRLTVINPTAYSTERLNLMTKNDMEYAVRVADEAAGIS